MYLTVFKPTNKYGDTKQVIISRKHLVSEVNHPFEIIYMENVYFYFIRISIVFIIYVML